jgi:hypothetical protein
MPAGRDDARMNVLKNIRKTEEKTYASRDSTVYTAKQ